MSPRGRRGNGARSEDDRQRARLEREQRRARREGRPVPRSVDDLPVGEPAIDPQDLGLDPRPDAGRATDPAGPPLIGATGEHPEGRRERLDAIRHAHEDPVAGAPVEETRRSHRPAPRDDAAGDAPADGAHTGTGPREASSSSPWWAQAPGGGAAPPPPAAGPPAFRPTDARAAASHPVGPDETRAHDPRLGDTRAHDPRLGDTRAADPRLGDTRPADTGRLTAPGQAPADAHARGIGDRPAPPRAPGHNAADDRTGPLSAPGATGDRSARRSGAGSDRPGVPRARDDADDWFGPDETDERTADPRPEDRGRSAPALVPLRPAGPARPTGTAPATVHTRTAPARRGVSRIAALIVLVPFVLVVAGAVFLFQPFAGEGEGEVRVKIEPGSSVDDIGKLLKEKGVVSNSLAFAIRARISGDGANLKAGTLKLKRGMSYGAALTALQQDPLPPSVVRVSLPEGLSRREAASTVRRAGITGSYLSATSRASGFDPTDYGQPRSRKGLEGFLFPATYELQRGGATAKDLVAEQLKSFRTNIDKVSMTRARRAKLSRYDVLIIASMIEREVRIASERRLVSAVIWNRLKDGTPLGIDATTRYAVRNWDRPLTQSEIDSKTPYDTRYRKGLPPTPIGSPGLAAIRAAANPAKVSYLFYVVEPCGDGKHAFASTNDQFLKDREAYNAAQRRAGGDPSPSDAKGCKG